MYIIGRYRMYIFYICKKKKKRKAGHTSTYGYYFLLGQLILSVLHFKEIRKHFFSKTILNEDSMKYTENKI